jgi:SAM-dependent methyltransferase
MMLPVKLVCPRCRVPDESGDRPVVILEQTDQACGEDLCPKCGTRYPAVAGIHCIPPDLDAFIREQAGALDPRWAGVAASLREAAEACDRLSRLEPGSSDFREAILPAVYALAHFPDSLHGDPLYAELSGNRKLGELVSDWLRRCRLPAEKCATCALDAGCGPGGLFQGVGSYFLNGVVGFDLRVSALRVAQRLACCGEGYLPFRAEGCRFEPVRVSRKRQEKTWLVQGDIVSPPFEAEVFPLVSAISLLDAVPDPFFALGQLDALLCAGGILLLATPYHWEIGVTTAESWFGDRGVDCGEIVRAALKGRHPRLPHLNYEILEEELRLPWALPGHRRLVHRYFLDVILARKLA